MTHKPKLKPFLKMMMKDERIAPHDYRKLKALLRRKSDKKVVDSIIHDEQRHLKLLKKIKRRKK